MYVRVVTVFVSGRLESARGESSAASLINERNEHSVLASKVACGDAECIRHVQLHLQKEKGLTTTATAVNELTMPSRVVPMISGSL